MALPLRRYSGNAQMAQLTAGISAGATTIPVAWPGGSPWIDVLTGNTMGAGSSVWTAVLDYGTASEEKVLCSTISGGNITVVQRGVDRTTATTHLAYAGGSTGTIIPCFSATELAEIETALQFLGNAIGSIATGNLLQAASTGNLAVLAQGAAGTVLTSAGAGNPSVFQSPVIPSSALTVGHVLQSDGAGSSIWSTEAWAYDSAWINVVGGIGFTNGWGQFTTVASYRKIGNRVTLRGGIGDGTAATSAFTLPAGFCPAQDSRFACNNGATTSINSVTITAGGLVQPFTGGTGARAFLDGISFLTD